MVSIPQLLERTGDGLFATDQGQRIVFCNGAACSILGLPEDRVVGRPCYEVLRCRDDEGTSICGPNCWIFQALRKGEELPSREMVLRRYDGRYLRCSLSFLAICDPNRLARALFLFRPLEAVRTESVIRTEAPPGAELAVQGEQWRYHVRHVHSGDERYFARLNDVAALMADRTGVPPLAPARKGKERHEGAAS